MMWFLPFIFLSRSGRLEIGIKRIEKPTWIWGALLLGAGGGIIVFIAGYVLFGNSENNWYISMRNSFQIDKTMMELPKIQLFLIYTFPALLFSPIGEEFFFRGIIHESIKINWGQRIAVWINALAFSGIHAFHHGIYWDSTGIHVRIISGLLWFLIIMGLSWIFTKCREKSGSIWTSVIAHSAFNLSMNITIFLFLI